MEGCLLADSAAAVAPTKQTSLMGFFGKKVQPEPLPSDAAADDDDEVAAPDDEDDDAAAAPS